MSSLWQTTRTLSGQSTTDSHSCAKRIEQLDSISEILNFIKRNWWWLWRTPFVARRYNTGQIKLVSIVGWYVILLLRGLGLKYSFNSNMIYNTLFIYSIGSITIFDFFFSLSFWFFRIQTKLNNIAHYSTATFFLLLVVFKVVFRILFPEWHCLNCISSVAIDMVPIQFAINNTAVAYNKKKY